MSLTRLMASFGRSWSLTRRMDKQRRTRRDGDVFSRAVCASSLRCVRARTSVPLSGGRRRRVWATLSRVGHLLPTSAYSAGCEPDSCTRTLASCQLSERVDASLILRRKAMLETEYGDVERLT